METLDLLLFEAWHRMSQAVRRERIRALKRSRRRFREALRCPMRESCAVIRAADTRIDGRAVITFDENLRDREPHVVTLSGELIRELVKPVMIPWPGVDYNEAARICGRDYQSIAGWAKSGIFKIDRYPAFGFPREGKRPLRPKLWTESPIDPNAIECRPPHRIWGSMWQDFWKNIPENFEMAVTRVPHMVINHGMPCFRGWYFLCPGRLDENEQRIECGRRSSYLYAPQTVFTIGKYLGDESGFDMPDDSGLAGQWFPALHDASKASGLRTFACRKCWKVRRAWMAHYMGWNDFVTHISGGLLYGRDVPRPADYPLEAIRYPKKGPKAKKVKKIKVDSDVNASRRVG